MLGDRIAKTSCKNGIILTETGGPNVGGGQINRWLE